MGRFVGLVGALTTVGAVAYLMAPLPQSASDIPASALSPRSGAPDTRVAGTSKPAVTPDSSLRAVASRPASRGEPTAVLVQQIQAELHRLGCYVGAIDGQWTDATQRAMQTLGERVSVLRPVDTPDYIMLALARSQASAVCAATQRSASARPHTRLTALAAPEIAGPGKGEIRPTSGTNRLAASEPGRPSASEPQKIWRAVPDAPPKRAAVRDADPNVEAARLKAARDELNRIEMRKRAAMAVSQAPQTSVSQAPPMRVYTPADQPASSSRPGPDTNRMALGVGPGDPLQAHIDPRNPNAPAILRAPPQPLPRLALQSGERPAAHDPALAPPRAVIPANAPPPGAAPRSAAPPPARVASKQTKREWQRNVFTRMQLNGP